MTPEQVKLVQQTFGQVAPIADKAAEIFYDRLFEVAPRGRPLFQGDMAEQKKKLMPMLAVAGPRPAPICPASLPAAKALAKRHVGYGARPEHYPCRRGAAVDAGARTRAAVDAGGQGRRLDRGLLRRLSGFMIAEAYGSAQAAE